MGVTVVLNVCVGNIVMGKEIVITESKQRMAVIHIYCYSVSIATKRQCVYNVTFWRFCVTTVVVERQKILHTLSVFIVLVTQHSLCLHHIVMCALSRSTLLFHIISKMERFSKKSY